MNNQQSRERRRQNIERLKEYWKAGIRDDARLGSLLGVTAATASRYRHAAGLHRDGPQVRGGMKSKGRAFKIRPRHEQYERIPGIEPAASTLEKKKRKCLRCRTEYESEWAGDRYCNSCRRFVGNQTGDCSLDARL